MDILKLEQQTFRSWEALESELYDGWLLRFANGYTRRSNSVSAIFGSTLNIDTKIAYSEAWYTAHGLPACFKMTEAVHPSDLDSRLEAKGYTREAESLVMTVELSSATIPVHAAVIHIETEHTEKWLSDFCQLNQTHAQHLDTMRALINRIQPNKYFASVIDNDEVLAVGLGVHHGDYVALFDIVTRADVRGQGYGTALVASLLQQAYSAGARMGFLQVLATNEPALRLYQKLGFKLAYQYWYRILR